MYAMILMAMMGQVETDSRFQVGILHSGMQWNASDEQGWKYIFIFGKLNSKDGEKKGKVSLVMRLTLKDGVEKRRVYYGTYTATNEKGNGELRLKFTRAYERYGSAPWMREILSLLPPEDGDITATMPFRAMSDDSLRISLKEHKVRGESLNALGFWKAGKTLEFKEIDAKVAKTNPPEWGPISLDVLKIEEIESWQGD